MYSFRQCLDEAPARELEPQPIEAIKEVTETEEVEASELRINIMPKKAQSTHMKFSEVKMNKTTKSAHMLGDFQLRETVKLVSKRNFSIRNYKKILIVASLSNTSNNVERLLTAKSLYHLTNTSIFLFQKPEMFEKQMGDSRNAHVDEQNTMENFTAAQTKPKKVRIISF